MASRAPHSHLSSNASLTSWWSCENGWTWHQAAASSKLRHLSGDSGTDSTSWAMRRPSSAVRTTFEAVTPVAPVLARNDFQASSSGKRPGLATLSITAPTRPRVPAWDWQMAIAAFITSSPESVIASPHENPDMFIAARAPWCSRRTIHSPGPPHSAGTRGGSGAVEPAPFPSSTTYAHVARHESMRDPSETSSRLGYMKTDISGAI